MRKKIWLINSSFLAMIIAPSIVIACSNKNNNSDTINSEHQIGFSQFTFDKHYKLNDTNKPFLSLAEINTSEGSKLFNDLVQAIYQEYSTSESNKIKPIIQFTDRTFPNWSEMRLNEIVITDFENKVSAAKDVGADRLKGLISEALINHSIERSIADVKLGQKESPLKNAWAETEQFGQRLSDYWQAYDNIYQNIYQLKPLDFKALTWNPYDLKSTFTVVTDKKIEIEDPDYDTPSEIDNTKVAIKKEALAKIPEGVEIQIYDYWNQPTDTWINKANQQYEFVINNHLLYQNIYLNLEIKDLNLAKTSYIPGKYHEKIEIMKLGNGLSENMVAKRTNYGQG